MQKGRFDIKVKVHKHTMPHPPIHNFTLAYTTSVIQIQRCKKGLCIFTFTYLSSLYLVCMLFGMPSIHLLVSALYLDDTMWIMNFPSVTTPQSLKHSLNVVYQGQILAITQSAAQLHRLKEIDPPWAYKAASPRNIASCLLSYGMALQL